MKRNKANIFFSWLLLICFIAGQGMIYAHQHKILAGDNYKTQSTAKNQARTIVQEKCSMCDAMHHTNAVINHYTYFSPNIVTKHFYRVYNYAFISIALILSAGRAPPVSASC
ncbi:hypothetical protein FO440_01960 [Mucilaginibacter corticis]|uniref:Uncharacterized protein n=1 Tax=Mucilaginibacter corticis TaxID=2597670 RepID=A0A556MSQ1_9SPHI|nr:hypothetical protein [Mucilaginibacter corticis]TSJ42981.1 hypothetical protein FO440_01960 [Mucilaginibacter corticis]